LSLAKELGLLLVNGKPTSLDKSATPFGLLCNADACFTLETDHDNIAADTRTWTQRLKNEHSMVSERLKMTATNMNNEREGY